MILEDLESGHDFVGGHWERLRVKGEDFSKLLNKKELNFYQKIYPILDDNIKKFMPAFRNLEKNEKGEFWLTSENLFHGGTFNQLDLKLADKDKNKYEIVPMWQHY